MTASASSAADSTPTTEETDTANDTISVLLRGMTLEEALQTVDMFLDGAVMNRLREVSIIHGKGTGILRAGIHRHLKALSCVKSFRLGRYGEGEDGVTVVTLAE